MLKQFRQAMHDHEGEFLAAALRAYRGNVSRTAAAIGVNRTAFHKTLRRHGLQPDEFRKARDAHPA